MNKRICGSFSGALFSGTGGRGKRKVIKLHLQIMSRSHLKHNAYNATAARAVLHSSTSNYTSVLHYAVILGIMSPLCPHCAIFLSLSFLLWEWFSSHREQEKSQETILQVVRKIIRRATSQSTQCT